MTKFSVLNLLLLTAVLALATSLFFENRNKSVTLATDELNWTVPEYLAPRSDWPNQSIQPSLHMMGATSVANKFKIYVESQSADTGYSNWQLVNISLRKVLNSEHPNFWVYVAGFHGENTASGEYQDLKIAILLDGSIAFDPSHYPFSLATTVRDFPDMLYAPIQHRYPLE